jgi:hypothetical protein
MGHFADGLGPFERFTFELRSLNELTTNAIGEPLFRTSERPREFGWILRPSQHEWDAFIHTLDKLLSENLRHDALDAAGAPKESDQGERLGTLNRLGAPTTAPQNPRRACERCHGADAGGPGRTDAASTRTPSER